MKGPHWKGLIFSASLAASTLAAMYLTFRQRGRNFLVPVVTIQEKRLRLTPSNPRQDGLPRIHIMAMTYNGLYNTDVWHDWYIRSRTKLSELGIEPLTPQQLAGLHNCTAPHSRFLTFQMTHVAGHDPQLIRDRSPCWMTEELFELAPGAKWGNMVGIYTNVKRAVLRFPNQTHYVPVSDTSVPLTLLPAMLQDLAADGRSRMRMWYAGLLECVPHHLAFYILAREEAVYLADNPTLWALLPNQVNNDVWVRGRGNLKLAKEHFKLSGPDEFWPGHALLARSGFQEKFHDTRGDGCLSQEIFPDNVNWLVAEIHDFKFYHWTTWFDIPFGWKEAVLGAVDIGGMAHPVSFRSMKFGLLQYLAEQDGVWFARKFKANATVTDCVRDRTHGDKTHEYYAWYRLTDSRDSAAIYLRPSENQSEIVCSLKDALAYIYDSTPS